MIVYANPRYVSIIRSGGGYTLHVIWPSLNASTTSDGDRGA